MSGVDVVGLPNIHSSSVAVAKIRLFYFVHSVHCRPFQSQQTVIIEHFRWIWIKFSTFLTAHSDDKWQSSVVRAHCSVMISFPVENHFHFSFFILAVVRAWGAREWARSIDPSWMSSCPHTYTLGPVSTQGKFYSLKLCVRIFHHFSECERRVFHSLNHILVFHFSLFLLFQSVLWWGENCELRVRT